MACEPGTAPSSQALEQRLEDARAAEELRAQQMAAENAALRQELAVYRRIFGCAAGLKP